MPVARPTLKDVARKAGVAMATASYALSGKGTISDDTRQRVQAASDTLGYEPNPHARHLRRAGMGQRTGNLAVVLVEDRCQDPIYLPLIQRFSQLVQERQCQPLVLSCPDTISALADLPYSLRQRQLDGFLLNGILDEAKLDLFRRLDLPFVVLGNHRVPPALSVIRTELTEGVLMGMEHLLELGHRRIGFVSEILDSPYQRDILRGYHEAHAAHNLTVDPALIRSSGQRLAGGQRPTAELLALTPRPTAILVTDYRVAGDVARTAERAGLALGRELSMVTLAGKYEDGFRPTLTRICDDIDRVVEVGLESLESLIVEPNRPPQRVSVPCQLVVGETTYSPSTT